MRRVSRLVAIVLLVWGMTHRAFAHSASSSYLGLSVQDTRITAQWSIALRDLDDVVGLDNNGDGRITWGELRHAELAVEALALSHLRLTGDGAPCPPGAVTMLADTLGDGGYAVLRFIATCPAAPRQIGVHYSLLFNVDATHRGLLSAVVGGEPHVIALSPDHPDARIDVTPGWGATFRSFYATGIDHLLTGLDHMLFISMLLVPAMFRRTGDGPGALMAPVSGFWNMFIESAKVLSAFTIAHGTTLTLSVLHLVYIPERLSEAGIALTILATALDNVFHFIPGRRWPLAFAFGLVHGLGFATALGPLALPPVSLALALIAFSLGLETAQLVVALCVLPIGFALRYTVLYRKWLMPGLSGVAALVAFAWFADRAADLGMMPF